MQNKKPPEVRIAELYSTVNWNKVDPSSRLLSGMLQLTYAESIRNTQRCVSYSTCRLSTLFMVGFAMLVTRVSGMTPRSTMMTVLATIFFLYVIDVLTSMGFKKIEDENYKELDEEITALAKKYPMQEDHD